MKVTLEFTCIDGNIAKYNVQAYCNYKKGFLTYGLQCTHKCIERGCKSYIPLVDLLKKLNETADTNHCIYVAGISNK